MTLEELNRLPQPVALFEFERCCGSRRWAEKMAAARPFASRIELGKRADEFWGGLAPADWLEAFRHHPRIGDVSALRAKFAATAEWAKGEQAGVAQADEETILALARGNFEYEKKFGYVFLVCATGKSAAEMLAILTSRLPNAPEPELRIAAEEQAKITRIRLGKLLT